MPKTIAENLELLQSTKTRIKDAITNTFNVDPGDEYAKYAEYIKYEGTPDNLEVKTISRGKIESINNDSVMPKTVKVMVKYEDMGKITKNFTEYKHAVSVGVGGYGMNNVIHKYKVEGEAEPRAISFQDPRMIGYGWSYVFPSFEVFEKHSDAYTEMIDGDKYFVMYNIIPVGNTLTLRPLCDIRYQIVKYEGWMKDIADLQENQMPISKPNVHICTTPSGKTLMRNYVNRIKLYRIIFYVDKSNNNGTITVSKQYRVALGTVFGDHQNMYIFSFQGFPGFSINDERYDKTNKTFTLILSKQLLSGTWFFWHPGCQNDTAWNYQTRQTEDTMAQNPFLNGAWKMISPNNAKYTYNDDGSITLVWNNVEFDGDYNNVNLFTGTLIK